MKPVNFRCLQDWLDWLESVHPSEIDLGLERVRKVAQAMKLRPLGSSKIITVAGTNGKGSCIATLEAFLSQEGKRFGSYTSPHLVDYNERIRLQGQPVSDESICDAFRAINDARGETTLTYFEFGTLAACYIMQQAAVDYWLLEVGLGGRLDAVNTFDADIAIITSIDIDHTEWLGDTRELIGREKAGIVRPGKPVVCAERDLPSSVLEYICDQGAQPWLIEKDFDYTVKQGNFDLTLRGEGSDKQHYRTRHVPELPHSSVTSAIQALRLAGELESLNEAYLEDAFKNLRLAGRFQKLDWQGKQLILDVAHNPAAVQALSAKIAAEKQSDDLPVVVVLAMMKDKLHHEALSHLVSFIDHWYLGDLEHMPRAAKAVDLQKVLENLGVAEENVDLFSSIPHAFEQAIQKNAKILVFGSFYALAEIYPIVAK